MEKGMDRSIAIIGTLDTKGEEIAYLKKLIENRGHRAVVIDVGIIGEPAFEPTITHDEVAEAAGLSRQEILDLDNDSQAMDKMSQGTTKIVKDLYADNQIQGALALGGTMGTSLALKVMRVLPIGVPKLILSTVAYSPLIPPHAYVGEVMTMPWASGFKGVNSINKKVLHQAAGAISGAVEMIQDLPARRKKTVAITAVGAVMCQYLNWLMPALEERGYEAAPFHAIGTGGRIMEQIIQDGQIDVVLDLALNELANEVCGGACSSGENRLEAAGLKGIPQIVNPIVNSFMWQAWKPLPERYEGRSVREHNWLVTNVPMNRDEKEAFAHLLADKLNRSRGPTAVVIPMKGRGWFSGGGRIPTEDQEGLETIVGVLDQKLQSGIRVVKVDSFVNEPEFSEKVIELFDDMVTG
jgi:uncharacterized protein (UPF0261 family)